MPFDPHSITRYMCTDSLPARAAFRDETALILGGVRRALSPMGVCVHVCRFAGVHLSNGVRIYTPCRNVNVRLEFRPHRTCAGHRLCVSLALHFAFWEPAVWWLGLRHSYRYRLAQDVGAETIH